MRTESTGESSAAAAAAAHTEEPTETTPLVPRSRPPATQGTVGTVLGGLTSLANMVSRQLAPARPKIDLSAKELEIVGKKKFSDGSQRPDSLVAKRNEASTVRVGGVLNRETGELEGGREVAANTFKLPTWQMEGTSKEAHTDAHMHPTNYVQRGMSPREVVDAMDRIGMRYSTQMPIPTSLIAITHDPKTGKSILAISPEYLHSDDDHHTEGGHHCGSLNFYYVPDEYKDLTVEQLKEDFKTGGSKIFKEIQAQGELYPDTAVDYRAAAALRSSDLTAAELDRLDPMITGIHLGDMRAAEKLLRTLYDNPGVFTGIGEITIHKELVQDLFAGKSQAHITKNIEAFVELARVAGLIGMPITLHCDAYDLHDQIEGNHSNSAQIDGIAALLSDPRLANTKITWAHGGGLGRFVAEQPEHLDKVQAMLDKNPKLMLDISWSQVAKQVMKTPESQKRWGDFIKKNSSRIMFGSDTLSPKDDETWNQTKVAYDELFNQLERDKPGIKHQILNDNYERRFVASRADVRKFEERILTAKFQKNALQPVDPKDSEGNVFIDPKTGKPAVFIGADFLEHELRLADRRDAAAALAAAPQQAPAA
jgi:hypothetical protein